MRGRLILSLALSALLLLGAASSAWARIVSFADVTVTGSVTTIRGANQFRRALNCTNTHATVHIRWGDSAITATRGQQLRAGTAIEITSPDAVSAISEGADVTVACTEELTP